MEEPIMEEPIMEEPIIEESTFTIKEHLDDCSICLENIINEEHKKITTCNHIFHEECMAKWILQNNSCPLCRKNIDLNIYGRNDEENDGDSDSDGDDDYDNPIINNSNTNNNISYNNTLLPDSLHVFAANYNVLRIMSGMGGLSYSS
jgi:hypothetical protein